MKVIKEGKWNVPWSGEFVCKTCDATLLVEEADLHATGNEKDVNYFSCPLCKKAGYVPKTSLPLRVLEALNAKRKYWSSGDPW